MARANTGIGSGQLTGPPPTSLCNKLSEAIGLCERLAQQATEIHSRLYGPQTCEANPKPQPPDSIEGIVEHLHGALCEVDKIQADTLNRL